MRDPRSVFGQWFGPFLGFLPGRGRVLGSSSSAVAKAAKSLEAARAWAKKRLSSPPGRENNIVIWLGDDRKGQVSGPF
jgi:hypothetical protein